MDWLRHWRRKRIVGRAAFDEALWRSVLARYRFMRALSPSERARLREQAILFLHEKSIAGAGGLQLRDEIRMCVAAQACMLVLNLDLDFYKGWVEVIVYPGEFLVDYEYLDEDGVAHRINAPMSGESWLGGPVILSWADTEQGGSGDGYNVVIHEFAHKLDMLNGEANGFPPLHDDMDRTRWSDTFGAAYEDFCRRVERSEEIAIDPYAAESPGEFFAVLSEVFFEAPHTVRDNYPAVYAELALFYRQDPALRLSSATTS
ncbi:MAG: M90 family metallopeptidase [Burkholderiales bacterium]